MIFLYNPIGNDFCNFIGCQDVLWFIDSGFAFLILDLLVRVEWLQTSSLGRAYTPQFCAYRSKYGKIPKHSFANGRDFVSLDVLHTILVFSCEPQQVFFNNSSTFRVLFLVVITYQSSIIALNYLFREI